MLCGNLASVFTVDYQPALHKIQPVVNLIAGDIEVLKLHPAFFLNSYPSPHLKALRKNEPLDRDEFSNILWEMALSHASRSVSCPRCRPLCKHPPCCNLAALRKKLLVASLRLLPPIVVQFVVIATGCDLSLTTASCWIGKVAQ